MMGKKHQAMMDHIMEIAEAKTAQAVKALKAENHIARVRRGYVNLVMDVVISLFEGLFLYPGE